MRVMKPSEIATTLKVLIYGRPGVGKTTLAKTMPQPVVLLDFEGGVLALLDSEVLIVPIQTIDDLRAAISELQTDTVFQSVVFDGLSLFVKRRIQELRASKPYATWQEWQLLTNEIRSAVLPLLHLKKHLLLTCLPRFQTIRDRNKEEVIAIEPDLTPALIKDITAVADLVGYLVYNDPLFPEISERTIIFAPINQIRVLCKSRIPNLTQSPPNFSYLVSCLTSMPRAQIAPDKELAANVSAIVAEGTAERTSEAIQQTEEQTHAKEEAAKETTEQSDYSATERSERKEQARQSDPLASQIFELARKLGIDNKSLGRIAKQYFGQPYVRSLSEDQKQTLLQVLQSELAKRQPNQPEETNQAQPIALEEEEGGDTRSRSVDEFLAAWKRMRDFNGEIPHEKALAEIAVKRGWLPDELEEKIWEQLLDTNFDVTSIGDGYWLSYIPAETLSLICEQLGSQS